jgi:serine/threonine-protein kinase
MRPGTEFAHYTILSQIGKGGMGEVWKARDMKLGREVALKVLPDAFARDQERMARFTREARLLASVNHPNIASIYGVEESPEQSALVLELIDGETLAERIARGPIKLDEALRIALQVAEALEAAHEKSVIHRDLKPANVKITPQGTVKVLDFGLAKALEEETGSSSNLSESPTLSAAATRAGVILGTASYMSPEQARGKSVDRRTDIWSFGVLFFEMLSARRIFEGETVTDTLAKILEREPDWHQLTPRTPAAVRKLLQHCLTKNVRDRLQAIGDARTLLQELTTDPAVLAGEVERVAYPLWKKLLPWGLAPVFIAAGWLIKPSETPIETLVSRFDYTLPGGQILAHNFRHAVELSPNGTRMAFVANAPGAPASSSKIYVKNMDQSDAIPIPGTEGGHNPFFSPDGEWLGFVQEQRIKKVPLTGGTPVVVVEELTSRSYGMSWGTDGTIVFADTVEGGLKQVRDSGGEPKTFTELDSTAQEAVHRLPHFLPDGNGVLFTVLRYTSLTPNWKRAQIWVQSLKTGERKLVLENAVDGRYVEDGYLVFARLGKLFAVYFDLKTLSVSGTPVPVLDGVIQSAYFSSNDTTTGAAQYSISKNGSFLSASGSIEPPYLDNLIWIDRTGKTSLLGVKPFSYLTNRLSRDGTHVAFSEYYVDKDIWVFDTARKTLSKQTFEGQNVYPIWSPDGSRLAFRSDRSGPTQIYVKALSSMDATRLTEGRLDTPSSWTPDGKELAFVRGTGVNADIYVVPVDEPSKVRPFVQTRFNERQPEFSTDGRWLAYVSDESGPTQVYVQPYPGPGKRVQVSTQGGVEPAWSKDGKELFFRNANRMFMVRFKTDGPEFLPEEPVSLWETQFGTAGPVRGYDVAADGRFLVRQEIPNQAEERNKKVFPSTLRIVLNWTEELDRLFRNENRTP